MMLVKIEKNRLGYEFVVTDDGVLRYIADESVIRRRGIAVYSNLKLHNINQIKKGENTLSYYNYQGYRIENDIEIDKSLDLRDITDTDEI